MADLLNSLSLYESLEAVTAKTPDDLVIALKKFKTPIKVIAIVADQGRHTAYVMGDIRKSQLRKAKNNG